MSVLLNLQKQLTYVEKKLDALIQQQQKPAFNREQGDRPFRPPFRRPDRPYQRFDHSRGGPEQRDPNAPRPFRPPFRRPDGSGQGFDPNRGPSQGPAKGKPPFYPKRKPFFKHDRGQ